MRAVLDGRDMLHRFPSPCQWTDELGDICLSLQRTRRFFFLSGPAASKATVLDKSYHEESYLTSNHLVVHLQCPYSAITVGSQPTSAKPVFLSRFPTFLDIQVICIEPISHETVSCFTI